MTIYGFISDESLHVGSSMISPSSTTNGDVGYASDHIVNYFLDPAKIEDLRSSRLTIFLNKALGAVRMHLDYDTIKDDDIITMSTGENEDLFNIAELLYLSQNQTEATLEASLLANPSAYGAYVADSLTLSTTTVPADIKLVDSSIVVAMPIRSWVSFSAVVGDGSETKDFKFWLSNEEFKTDYPITNIVSIVPPCDPAKLISVDYANTVESLVESSAYMNTLLNTAVANNDHTGYVSYNAKYVNDSYGTYYNMPFGILYKGAEPSGLSLKITVRDYLESLGIGTVDIWKSLFPDLYTTSQYFIVPLWDNISILPTRTIYPSVIDYPSILTTAKSTLNSLTEAHVENNIELLTCAVSEVVMIAVPHPDNDNTNTILEEHPTYQAIDSQDITFDYQETHTKEFNNKLSNCLVVLDGGSNEGVFTETTIDGILWLSFITNFMEYHVLSKEYFTD